MDITFGDIVGLIAALGFILLVGFLAIPLWKFGRVLDSTRESIEEITEHTLPVIDESAQTVAATNQQLERVDTITTSVAQTSQNISALTTLFSATLGGPLIKVAAFSYGVRKVGEQLADAVRPQGASLPDDDAPARPRRTRPQGQKPRTQRGAVDFTELDLEDF